MSTLPSSDAVVELREVGVIYPSGHRALVGVNLSLHRGEFVFLVGPSGAGKSTLVSLLVRDVSPSSGEVHVAGHAVHALPASKVHLLRRRVGVVFQNFRLLPRRTIWENTAFALEVTGAPREEIDAAVERALRIVGLADLGTRYPAELSGGEQQRAAIARALAMEPDVMLFDEPTSALDVSVQAQILNLLKELRDAFNLTYVFISHDLGVVEYMADRIAVMYLEIGRAHV